VKIKWQLPRVGASDLFPIPYVAVKKEADFVVSELTSILPKGTENSYLSVHCFSD